MSEEGAIYVKPVSESREGGMVGLEADGAYTHRWSQIVFFFCFGKGPKILWQ